MGRGGPVAMYVRGELRRRPWSHLALALVVALGVGAALGAAVLAHRTDHAYGDYVERSRVTRLVVNPSLWTDELETAVRSFAGIRSVHTDDLLLGTVTGLDGGVLADLLADPREALVQVHGSVDGRYVDVDRPAVSEGRLPTGDHELFVTEDMLPDLEDLLGRPVQVGDEVDMAFYDAVLSAAGLGFGPDLGSAVRPIGVERLRVTGIGTLGDEVLPDDLYPRQRMVVSPDVARRYACRAPVRSDMSKADVEAMLTGCSAQYRYYSFDLEPGTSVADVRTQFEAAAADLSPTVPPVLADLGVGFSFISQDRSDLDRAVHQTTRPTVAALASFSVVAGLATVVVVAVSLLRILRRRADDHRVLVAVGAPTTQRTAMVAGAPVLASAVGLVAAVLVAAATSRLGPLGSVRSVVPHPGVSLPSAVVVPVLAGAALVVLVGGVVLPALLVSRRAARPAPRSAWHRRGLGPTAGPPTRSLGVRAAIGGDGSGAGLAVALGSVVVVALVVAAVIFGTNLAAVAGTPSRYGWPWQVGVITGGGYGSAEVEVVEADLAGAPGVADHSLLGFDPAVQVDGTAVPTIFSYTDPDLVPLPIVSGRRATGPGEVVLGQRTADELDVQVGDRVELVPTEVAPVTATVVGTAVLPDLGSFVADRTSLGRGAFVPIDDDPAASGLVAFVGVRLDDGSAATRLAFLDHIRPGLLAWDGQQSLPLVLDQPSRPPEIVDIDEMRRAPLLVAATLAVALVVGLAMSISLSVRDRRRDLGVLQTLGLTGAQVRATVRWQALTVVAVGLVAGVPLGVVAGRLAWRAFATDLGLVPRADLPAGWVLAVVAGAVVLGLVAAVVPARAATRLPPAVSLRSP